MRVAPEAKEITTALALLKSLPLEGAIITGDAAFCQRVICQAIRDVARRTGVIQNHRNQRRDSYSADRE